MRLILILLTAFLILALSRAATAETSGHNPITGLWITQDHDAAVELYECDGQICGRFHWLKNEVNDIHNRDPKKQSRPLCNMQFVGGFKHEEDDSYGDGWIYNPQDGATYDAEMNLTDPDTLRLHGYVVVPLFGQSQTWHRIQSSPACKMGRG